MTLSKLNLEITGKQMAECKPTGMHDTESGAVMLTPSQRSAAVARLVENEPQATDIAVLSSLTQHGICLRDKGDWRFPTDADPYFVDRGFEIIFSKKMSPDVNAAIQTVTMSMSAMPIADMEKSLLTTMMLMVKPSGESSQDAAMRCKLYANQMRDWPADIFVKVLDIIAKTQTFWPAFAEFNKHYERLIRNRKNMLKTLQKCTK